LPELNTVPSFEADTALLVESVREAGAIARGFFGNSYKAWDKGHGNPVTEADIAVDRRLNEILLSARPDYGWLSEETEDDRVRLSRERVFVVDPIDGTVGFLKGRPQFTIVAAVVSSGRPTSAAIYNPITEEMYYATTGLGAWLNGAPVRVSPRETIGGAQILAPRAYFAPENWRTPWPSDIHHETRSSIAYRLALVAEGRFDAMISLTAKHDWDLAAGDLVVNEAGGRLTAPGGAVLSYNNEHPLQRGAIGANPVLHARLLERITEELN
jgi:myo-inositol-1(or 4)-monophosphatase